MQVAPLPYLSAYLEVIRVAAVEARFLAHLSQLRPWWQRLRGDARTLAQVADLMDAIHVIPELLDEWERCDEPALRRNFLLAYDQKWARPDSPTERRVSLVGVFERAF